MAKGIRLLHEEFTRTKTKCRTETIKGNHKQINTTEKTRLSHDDIENIGRKRRKG